MWSKEYKRRDIKKRQKFYDNKKYFDIETQSIWNWIVIQRIWIKAKFFETKMWFETEFKLQTDELLFKLQTVLTTVKYDNKAI